MQGEQQHASQATRAAGRVLALHRPEGRLDGATPAWARPTRRAEDLRQLVPLAEIGLAHAHAKMA
ncbi:hypothetical protein [Comamonas serinivorans]|nr:hypothetical protein [Comamonas serinivorans]